MTQSRKPLPPIETYDPLARFLTRTLRLSPFAFGLLVFVGDVLVDGWLGWHYDAFVTSSGVPGLLQDLTALVVDFVSNPVLCGVYLWTIDGANRMFRQLQESGVVRSEEALVRVVKEAQKVFKSAVVFYVALAISLLLTISQVGAYVGWLPWKTVGGYIDLNPAMSYFRAPFWALTFYALPYGAFNVALTIVTLRRLFSHVDVQPVPLHPDRCGGLSSISQYSVNVAYVIGAFGLVISSATVYELRQGTLLAAYPVLAGIAAYVVFAPLYFFWPLGTAHRAMRDAKDDELLQLARQFDAVYDQVKQGIADQGDGYKGAIKRLKQLKKLYAIADAFPVWPFDTRSLRRFFTVVTTPLIPALVSLGVEVVRSLFLP